MAVQINWIATQTRPDLAHDTCEISTSVKNATVEDVMQANKVIKKAKSDKVRLRFRDLGDKEIRIDTLLRCLSRKFER